MEWLGALLGTGIKLYTDKQQQKMEFKRAALEARLQERQLALQIAQQQAAAEQARAAAAASARQVPARAGLLGDLGSSPLLLLLVAGLAVGMIARKG
jgi:hypothetical protein